jgi:hypothetical protein
VTLTAACNHISRVNKGPTAIRDPVMAHVGEVVAVAGNNALIGAGGSGFCDGKS